jgi:hypothetical protein
MMKRYTTKEASKYLGVCIQRIQNRLLQGHFPNHAWCECGRSILIPKNDLDSPPPTRREKRRRKLPT